MKPFSSTARPKPGPRTRRLAAVAASVLLAAASLAAPAIGAGNRHEHSTKRQHTHLAPDKRGCANAATPTVSVSSKATREAVVCLINQQRAAHGLPALRSSRRLDRSAQGWTNTMVATQSFAHGSDFSARITAVGFVWQSAGENIATGFPTPQAVVSAWMASPGHCQNILNPTYGSVGTGINRRPVGNFASGPATWTQDFALPMGARAPSDNWGPSRSCAS